MVTIVNSRTASALGLFVTATLVVVVLTSAAMSQTRNLLYINSNIATTGQNSVIALVNDGAGNLSPVAGSPFATGGTGVDGLGTLGTDTPWDADGQIMLNKSATLLFAANGHSNDISAFVVNSDGTLTAVSGSPFPSAGPQPATIGYQDNALGNGVSMMIVGNRDADFFQNPTAPNFATFSVSSDGVPTLLQTLTLPAGYSPSHVLVRQGSKQYFMATLFGGMSVNSYKLTRAGTMTQVSSVPFDAPATGAALNPLVRGLYVTVPPTAEVNMVTYDMNSNLSLFKTLTDPGMAVCWNTVNKAATRMYTGETVSGTVSVWDITKKPPIVLQTLLMTGATNPLPSMVQLDPTEKFLYALDRHGYVHVLDVASDGTLAENHAAYGLGLPSPVVPPLGMVVALK